MANVIKYNSRITLKYDSLTNWKPNGTWIDFTPLKGEVCIINPSETLAAGATCLFKVGDGKTKIGDLHYMSALAADVHEWAKKSETDFLAWVDEKFASQEEIDDLESRVEELEEWRKTLKVIDKDASGEATVAVTSVIQEDGKIEVTKKNLPSMTAVTGTKIEFIDSVSQSAGKVSATKREIPTATKNDYGVVKIDIEVPSKSDYDDHLSNYETFKTDINSYRETSGTTKRWKDAPNGNVIVDTYATKVALNELSNKFNSLEDGLENISNVMNFKGVAPSDPTKITSGYQNGDVVIFGSKEYVYSGTEEDGSFVEFGDTSAQNQAIEDLESAVESIKSYAKVTGDTGSATAQFVNDTLTINGDEDIITVAVTDSEEKGKDVVAISHKKVTKADVSNLTDTVKLTPSINTDTFTAVDSIVYDNYGHVSAVKTKTVTVDVTDINSKIGSLETGINNHKSFSTVKAGSTDLVADGVNDTLNVAAGTAISVTGNANTDTMTIAHASVTRTDPEKATPPTSLNHLGTFTVVDSVSSNAQGHITGVQLKDYKLPAGYDDSDLRSKVGILERDTWKTVTRNKVTQVDDNTNGNFTTGLQDSYGDSTLNKSDLTIGTDVIGYIIWDCGSASKNI